MEDATVETCRKAIQWLLILYDGARRTLDGPPSVEELRAALADLDRKE